MPHARTNGIRLCYERAGAGDPVLLVMGSGAAGRVWTVHQTLALHEAGYETVIFDNRGMAPSDAPPGRYTLEDMVADTAGLIESLGLTPCRLVGFSLGAVIVQELAVRRPELVRGAVLMATRARSDALRRAQSRSERAMADAGIALPRVFDAVTTAGRMLSPSTLNDDSAASMWLDVLELSGGEQAPGQAWVDLDTDRRDGLRGVTAPCRVIAFSDDLISPPHLAAEVAEAIPRCDLVEIPAAGHLGLLERPQEVNRAIIEFLAAC
ncbi:alpha/beta fold hydrolase [Spirillospora sp. CA-253888]